MPSTSSHPQRTSRRTKEPKHPPPAPLGSALLVASRDANLTEMRRLIRLGAPVEARDTRRNLWFTPLSWAAYGGIPAACEMLLDAGASHAIDAAGRTPLALASWSGHLECAKLLASSEQARLCDDQGWTPLMRAAAGGRSSCARLLAPISDLAAANINGWRAIAIAAAYGQTEALAVLLAQALPADVEAIDSQGWTPLMRAAGNGQRQAALALINAGANPLPWGPAGPSAPAAARASGWGALAAELQSLIDAKRESKVLAAHLNQPPTEPDHTHHGWL